MPPSRFPILIIMIRLDDLASQTGFQRAVSPNAMYFCSLFPCYIHMLLSGGWLLLEMASFMVTKTLLFCHLFIAHIRLYVRT